jgi:hypothetical protein
VLRKLIIVIEGGVMASDGHGHFTHVGGGETDEQILEMASGTRLTLKHPIKGLLLVCP